MRIALSELKQGESPQVSLERVAKPLDLILVSVRTLIILSFQGDIESGERRSG